jgi:hypothetical protein
VVRRALRPVALMVVLALGACSESAAPATQLSLLLTSDLSIPDQLDELRVRVVGPDGTEQSASGRLRVAGDLPRRLVLRYTHGELAPLEVTAEGWLGGEAVVTRRARFAFVLNERRAAELALLARCIDVRCGQGTCTEDGCVDVALGPAAADDASAELDAPDPADAAASDNSDAAASGSADNLDDAGAGDAGLDGGATDGGRPEDAGARDAGPADGGRLPPGDGGWVLPDGCVPTQACVTACSEASPRRRAEVCQCLLDCQ